MADTTNTPTQRFRQGLALRTVTLFTVLLTTIATVVGAGVVTGVLSLNTGSESAVTSGGDAQVGDTGRDRQDDSGNAGPGGVVQHDGTNTAQSDVGNQDAARDAYRGDVGSGVGGTGNDVDRSAQTGTTAQNGTNNRISQDRQTSSTTERRTSRSSESTQAGRDQNTVAGPGNAVGNANGSGQQNNNSRVTNNPPPAPVRVGSAKVIGWKSTDGLPGTSSFVTISLEVDELPNNGNRLYFVCDLLVTRGYPHLYYGKVRLDATGKRSYDLSFGSKSATDPAIIGSTRLCGVISADPTASDTIEMLMQKDRDVIYRDPATGTFYDDARVALPSGTAYVSNQVRITVDRLTTPQP